MCKVVVDIMRKAGIDAEILYLYSCENENNKIKDKEENKKG